MNEPTERSSVLVVCGDPERRDTICGFLTGSFEVRTAANVAAALDRLDQDDSLACVVTVEDLPDGSGVDLATDVRDRDPDLPVVLYPERADATVASAATGAGVTDYLPAELDSAGADLRDRVADAVATYRRRHTQRRESDMFSSMLDSLPIAIYVKDDEARHLRLSDVRGGADPAEAWGKTDYELHGHEISQQSYEDDLSVIESGEPIENKPEMHATEGVPVWFETTKVPWRADDGSVKGLIGITYEITHLKQTERNLRRRIHWLERFTDYVTHDLRNPIHVAQGNLELARIDVENGDVESAMASLATVDEAIDRMDDIVADLSEMTEAADPGADVSDRGSLVALSPVIEDVWARLETGDCTLRNDLPAGTTLYAVESYLYPLIENLFKNAVEHGGTGTTVTVGATDDGFFVADDGPGIPESQRDRLNRPGYSGDEDSSSTGLNIVADIAVAHNWDIEAGESEDGGARFAFGNCLLVGEAPLSLDPVESLALEEEADVGEVKVDGAASYDERADRWTVSGGGSDLWRDINEFHFVFRRVDHPVRITATVASIDHVEDYSKAGVMVRDDLTEPSTYGYVGQTPAEGSEVIWRDSVGEHAVSQQLDPDGIEQRYRLDYDGDVVTASVRIDGEWCPVDQRHVGADGSVAVGLVVCSVASRYRCEAVFEDVRVERLDAS